MKFTWCRCAFSSRRFCFLGIRLGELLGFAFLYFFLDPMHQVLVIGVLELAGIPALGHVIDQALGKLDLLAGDVRAFEAFFRQREILGRAQLVGIA